MTRLKLVELAFESLQSELSDSAPKQLMLQRYNAAQHPDVLQRRKSAGQVIGELQEFFEAECSHRVCV